ncbi:protein rep [Acinetobacter bereziniae]|uniref:protein rep n=1 Tax=Acinetobacter bereziniae TaxID=106648 RepID=UPI0018DD6828|nr:protein rep [Acinetobacter bereziniae]MBI0393483.1 protein rep [Acinetobacter bereziniae]
MADFNQNQGSLKNVISRKQVDKARSLQSFSTLDINKRKLSDISFKKQSSKHKSYNSFKHKLRVLIQTVLKTIDSKNKVITCGKSIAWNRSEINILYMPDLKKANFTNVAMCKKSWLCPVCASKLASEKRAELLELQKVVNSQGLHVYMMTLTVPHTKRDGLEDLLEKLKVARSRFIDELRRRSWKKKFSKIGHITILEVTYSETSGWHPHLHILVVSEQYYDDTALQLIEGELYKTWTTQCQYSGLKKPSRKYSINLKNCASEHGKLDTKVINYLLKHGFINLKHKEKCFDDVSKGMGITIWEIAQLAGDSNEMISKKYRLVLKEYVRAMVKRDFVRWSDLLNEYLKAHGYAFKDREVQRIKKREQRKIFYENSIKVLTLTKEIWHRICRASYTIRSQLLRAIELDIQYLSLDTCTYPRTDRLLKYIANTKLYL